MNDEQAPAELEGAQAAMGAGELPPPDATAQGFQPVNISCTRGFPDWLLRLLAKYPTAPALGRARPATLARIPYLTPARATRLVPRQCHVAPRADGAAHEPRIGCQRGKRLE